jgi:hypothetical protein
MPLNEKRIALLVLRYIAKVISPGEYQELMKGYVNQSPANRLEFEKMINRGNLIDSLRDYYAFMAEVDGADTSGDPGPTDPPIPDFPFPPGK